MLIDEKKLHEAFDEIGVTLPNWRIKITNKELIRNRYGQWTDYATLTVDIYKYRCRKPTQRRYLTVNTVKGYIDLERSTYINL